jgi:cytochrome c oxidase cbb3-type subunit 3
MSYSSVFLRLGCLALALVPAAPFVAAQADIPVPKSVAPAKQYSAAVLSAGQSAFLQNCAFCHGKDTGGGESGPDLTRSKLVADDVDGSKIGPVVRNGQGIMPKFAVAESELAALVAFIHDQKRLAESQTGGRKGVETADLKTGNVEKGKAYFNGAGTCSKCHSVTGDLAGIAKKYAGLQLMQRTLYPRGAKVKLTVTPATGEAITGDRVFQDEFTVALKDSTGRFRSFSTSKVKIKVDAPAEAHVELLPKYSDDDLHDLMTYLLSLQ